MMRACGKKSARDPESGIALVITLMITALLVVVITEIVHGVHLHQSMTGLFIDAQSAGLLAEGSVELSSVFIKESTDDKYTYLEEQEALTLPVEENLITIKFVDEEARVSVNAIIKNDGTDNEKFFLFYLRLLEVLDLPEDLASSAADWADNNDEPRGLGAEDHDYYMHKAYPYRSKGAPFDYVGELALVKGYDQEVMDKLRPFVTVYGNGLVNINNAPREVLMALSVDMTGEIADAVIAYRKETPFKRKNDIEKVPGIGSIDLGLITVESKIFRIFSTVTVGDALREVEAVVELGSLNKKLFWRER
jgi:general secretion pathway protein K